MANTQSGAIDSGFVDKRRSRDSASPLLTESYWYSSVPLMRARLGGLAKVTADGVNTVTVDSTAYLAVGQNIDTVSPSTGVASISNRQITGIAGLVVTYNGADGTAAVNDVVCITGGGASVKYHTASRLDSMTVNDLVYALRQNSGDSAGI